MKRLYVTVRAIAPQSGPADYFTASLDDRPGCSFGADDAESAVRHLLEAHFGSQVADACSGSLDQIDGTSRLEVSFPESALHVPEEFRTLMQHHGAERMVLVEGSLVGDSDGVTWTVCPCRPHQRVAVVSSDADDRFAVCICPRCRTLVVVPVAC